jgi:hypothetical protein
MFFTIFCCVSTGLTLYCILHRFNKRTVDLAVHAAVFEVKKELHERHSSMLAQLATKERELNRARELLKLHEAVPTLTPPGARAVAPAAAASAAGARPGKKKPREGYELFEMSRPFTDTSYNDLLRATDVVKVEPAGM